MSADALQKWKSRILTHQQQIRANQSPQQATLFDLIPSLSLLQSPAYIFLGFNQSLGQLLILFTSSLCPLSSAFLANEVSLQEFHDFDQEL